ncbi:DUF421 domain-containing protein [uncultured Phycicoccus sp.]|uniref:DUF421 domain-containing protein n=1 Tax=uncultured Phycicoccus sp. TaxID=661422 RepID=UPI0026330F59|nr:YetF domain-containing protein [uncultured Phycicoccus sp.]
MFFDQWSDLVRVLVVGSTAYAALVLILRLSGKRTLAKLNAFDLVVTVALGSTLATVLLSSDISVSEGVAAMGLLVLLQFVVALLSSRSRGARRAVKSSPTLLVHRGRLLEDRLSECRVTAGEVRQATRSAGIGGFDLVEAVVLETDGSLSVVPRESVGAGDALADLTVPQG